MHIEPIRAGTYCVCKLCYMIQKKRVCGLSDFQVFYIKMNQNYTMNQIMLLILCGCYIFCIFLQEIVFWKLKYCLTFTIFTHIYSEKWIRCEFTVSQISLKIWITFIKTTFNKQFIYLFIFSQIKYWSMDAYCTFNSYPEKWATHLKYSNRSPPDVTLLCPPAVSHRGTTTDTVK